MNAIFLLLTTLIVLSNLLALGVLCRQWVPLPGIARLVGISVVVTALLLVEHVVGLGQLNWLWPITTLAAVVVLQRRRVELWQQRETECVFLLGFAYGFAWRFAFPDLVLNSEAITNIGFIANYFPGTTLPPIDSWLPPYRFDYYYALQHYATALLGRSLGVDIGVAYSFAWCIVMGLLAELVWCLARLVQLRRLAASLLVMVVLTGGNGVAPFEHRLWKDQTGNPGYDAHLALWHSTRFIGLYDKYIDTEFGYQLVPGESELDLPLETVGYLTMQGDLHAPLSGFLLLILALCIMVALAREHHKPAVLAAVLGGSVSLTLAANAWVFPMQAILVVCWFGARLVNRQPVYVAALVAGALVVSGLLYPYLTALALNARPLALLSVPDNAYTPFHHFVLMHWPWGVLSLLALWNRTWRSVAVPWVLALAIAMLMAEFLVMNDGGGAYQRFTTVLKWWSWTHLAVVAGLGAMTLAADSRWVRLAAVVVLLALCTQTFDLARFYYYNDKPHKGRLQADGSLAHLPGSTDVLLYLKQQPPGVVLERPGEGQANYMVASLTALLSGHQSFLGWPGHLHIWGRPAAEVQRRQTDLEAFYQGSLPNALSWLLHNRIDHVLWTAKDSERSADAFAHIQQQIGNQYGWHEFRGGHTTRVGVWTRLK